VRAIGLIPRVGLAASRTAARMAAVNGTAPVTIVPPGRERATLAKIPLTTLDLAPDLAATLGRWGVRTLGELAALPREGLAARLGPPGLRAHDLALGLDRDPFRPWTPPPFWEEAQGLEWEIDSLGILAGVLETVLERLCRRLAAVSLVADSLEVRLGLASGGHHARDVALAYPMSEVKPMLTLAVLDLEAHPPPAAVTRVAISAHPIRTQAGQGGLWQPPAPAPRDLVTVLARLAALVGADNLGSPVLLDSHRADAFAMLAFSPPSDHPAAPAGSGTSAGGAPGRRLALRRTRPARRVEVETIGERPVRVAARLVVASAGPWRASGEWWDLQAWARDEWDVVLGDGALCRLARDRLAGHWYLDGFYD
jgi:protein ImuB